MSVAKQDRQGARTPAALEQKYGFQGGNEAVAELRKASASFAKAASEIRQQMALMQAEINKATRVFVPEPIAQLDGNWGLLNTTYTGIKRALDAGRIVALYSQQSDGSLRYYYCMGTTITDGKAGLLFQYGYGDTAQSVTVSEDNSVTLQEGGTE